MQEPAAPPVPTRPGVLGHLISGLAPWGLFVVALMVFAVGIADLPVIDRDEARFAQASRQMAETGDWVDIRFQEQARHKKPAGIYWLQAGIVRALDAVETREIWIYRLPSLLAAAFACAALAWAGRPLVGRRAALLAGALLGCIFMLHAEARIAKTDAALVLATILAMGALARVWIDKAASLATVGIFWTALAAGFLLKGPILMLPVAGAVIWVSAFDRSVQWLKVLRPLQGALWALALTAPWYIAILWVTGGAFLTESLFGDLASKVATGQESHGAPPGSYLLAFWITFWPWGLLAPLALVHGWRNRLTPGVMFIAGWVLPTWLIFEMVPTKLIHYTLPVYPGVLLLCAAALAPILSREARFEGWAAHLGTIGWAVGGAALWGLVIVGPVLYGDGVSVWAAIGALAAAAIGLKGVLWLYRQEATKGALAVGTAGIVTLWTLFAITLPAARSIWISPRMAEATEAQSCLSGPVLIAGYAEPSAIFLLGTQTRFASASEALAALAETPNRAAWISDAAFLEAGMEASPPGVPDVTEVAGLNYSNGQDIRLRLFISPGIPAPDTPCPD